MAENNLYSCDNIEIYQSISDENTKEDDEKEAGTQTGLSLNNCKDRGQAISNASHGFGNQVTDTTRNTKEQSNSSASNEKETNNLNFQGMAPPPLNSKINSSPSRQLNAATKGVQNNTAPSNHIRLSSVAKSNLPNLQVQQETTNEQRRNDTEMDAKPTTPMTEKIVESIPEKIHEQMYQLEKDILRPKDHNDQPMTPDHLIDVVIVYAKSDYELANEYKEWLNTIAFTKSLFDIKVELYTSEDHFPANDVRVVEEVVNKSMRVLMLLSANFTEEVSLTFIKEETIGLTRLQECPYQDMMSLFATSIMNRKKNCVRPVHTAPPKGRYYRIPPGLSALRAFNYYQPNKESCYEKDITKAFLKSARDDRESYTKELCNHQARDNPHIAQAMETQMTIPYCNSTSLSNQPDRPDGGKNIDQATLASNKPFRSQETSNHISREDHGERGSSDTFDSISNQEVVNNQLQTEAVLNTSPPRTSNSKLHVQETNTVSADSGFSREGQEDIEPDGNAGTDSSTSKLLTLENSAGGSLIQDSLMSDTNLTTLVEFPTKSSEKSSNHNSNLYDKTEHAMKHKQIDVGEVRENTLKYTGPSGRSGIRTGTSQDYTEYNSNANTQWPRSSTDNRNEINSGRIQDNCGYHRTSPHYANQAPPSTVVPNPQSIHYHYHYSNTDTESTEFIETDQGPVTGHQQSIRQPSTSRYTRPSSPTRTGPVFNIQGCATVQIGESSIVIGNQNVEATDINRPNDDDDIGNRRTNINDNDRPVDGPTHSDSHDNDRPVDGPTHSDSHDNDRPVDGPTHSDSHDYTEEPHMSYGHQGRESLNILSPISDQEKLKNFCNDDSSSESNDNDDMSNSNTKQEDSEDMFGNGNSLLENLSSSFSDKFNTEKVIFDEETSSPSEEDHYNKKEVQLDETENLQFHRTEDIANFSSEFESSIHSEYTSLSTHLRWESRKKGQCSLQYHYNKQVRCYTTGSKDIHDEDDID